MRHVLTCIIMYIIHLYSYTNQFMEQMLDRQGGGGVEEPTVDKQQRTIATLSENLERVERELSEEKRKSTEWVVHAVEVFTNDISGANKIWPVKSQNILVRTQAMSFESRWANIRNRLSGENSRNRSFR